MGDTIKTVIVLAALLTACTLLLGAIVTLYKAYAWLAWIAGLPLNGIAFAACAFLIVVILIFFIVTWEMT